MESEDTGWIGEEERELFRAFALVETVDEAKGFLLDLFSQRELRHVAKRWCLMKELLDGDSQTSARSKCGASRTTAGRCKQAITGGSGVSRLIWQRSNNKDAN